MRPALVFMAVAVVGCGPGASLTTDRASYQRGETVTLTLRNHALGAFGYNLCFSTLLSAESGVIGSSDGSACQAIQKELPAGGIATGVRTLPESLIAGRYRYQTRIEGPDAQDVRLESPGFQVTAQ